MNRSDIRTQARAITELDTSDVSDTVLNLFIKEGYIKMLNLEHRWPWLEYTADLVVNVNDVDYPGQFAVFKEITSVTDLSGNGTRLTRISHEMAEQMFIADTDVSSANPWFWSVWNSILYIWPKLSGSLSVRLRGYRAHTAWYNDDTTQVDAAAALHEPLVYYAVSQLYAMQEDVQMSQFWMSKYDEAVKIAQMDLMRGSAARPLQLSHGVGELYGPRPYVLSWWDGRR